MCGNYLQKTRSLHSIVDFEHFKVFNNASAYTCLIFLDNAKREAFGYTTCSDPKTQLHRFRKGSLHEGIEVLVHAGKLLYSLRDIGDRHTEAFSKPDQVGERRVSLPTLYEADVCSIKFASFS